MVDAAVRFLDTVRSYAHRCLDESGETASVLVRLARWYRDELAGTELENLRAVGHAVAPHDPAAAQQLACSIGRLLDAVQSYSAGIDELEHFASDVPAPTPSRVTLLMTPGRSALAHRGRRSRRCRAGASAVPARRGRAGAMGRRRCRAHDGRACDPHARRRSRCLDRP
jgi:hypothetical protein